MERERERGLWSKYENACRVSFCMGDTFERLACKRIYGEIIGGKFHQYKVRSRFT